MEIIQYVSLIAIPVIILIIIGYGLLEKNKVYDTFVQGAKEGMEVVISIFPTLIGIFLAVGALRSSGVLEFVGKMIEPVTRIFQIPNEIIPLALIKPISGSASTALATDIMTTYGVESTLGLMAAVIMGATETTLYTIAVYTGAVNIKKTRFVLAIALIADIVGMLIAVFICRNLS